MTKVRKVAFEKQESYDILGKVFSVISQHYKFQRFY